MRASRTARCAAGPMRPLRRPRRLSRRRETGAGRHLLPRGYYPTRAGCYGGRTLGEIPQEWLLRQRQFKGADGWGGGERAFEGDGRTDGYRGGRRAESDGRLGGCWQGTCRRWLILRTRKGSGRTRREGSAPATATPFSHGDWKKSRQDFHAEALGVGIGSRWVTVARAKTAMMEFLRRKTAS